MAASVISVLLLIIIRDRPTHFPSMVAFEECKVDKKDEGFCRQFARIFSNKNYTMLVLCFALLNGIFVAIGRSLSALYAPFGFTVEYITIVGILIIVCGIFSSMLTGCALDKTSKYLVFLRMIALSSTLSAGVFLYSLILGGDDKYFVGTMSTLLGICILPILPCGVGFASELTFPEPSILSNAILQMAGQIAGFVIGICTVICSEKMPRYTSVVFVICGVFATLFTICIKEDLRRSKCKGASEFETQVVIGECVTENLIINE